MDASTVMNDLDAYSTASTWLGYEIYAFVSHYRRFTDNLTPIEKFYSLSKIQPLMRRSVDALSYDALDEMLRDGPVSTCTSSLQILDVKEKAAGENACLSKRAGTCGMSIGLSSFFRWHTWA